MAIFNDVDESGLRLCFVQNEGKFKTYITDLDETIQRQHKNLVSTYLDMVEDCARWLTSRWAQIKRMDPFSIEIGDWLIEGWGGTCSDLVRIPGLNLKITNQKTGCMVWFLGNLNFYDLDLDHCDVRLDQVEGLLDTCKQFADDFDQLIVNAKAPAAAA